MRRVTICMALALTLPVAGVASAKEVLSAKVCGKSACRTVKDRKALMALGEGGPPADPPDHPVAWYRARLTVDTGGGKRDSFSTVVAPDAQMVRGTDQTGGVAWLPVSRQAAREYRAITRGLAPFPAATLTGLDRPGRPKVRVDEVVLPAADSQRGGGAAVWPWIAGGLALLAVAGFLVRRRASAGGSPGPAQG